MPMNSVPRATGRCAALALLLLACHTADLGAGPDAVISPTTAGDPTVTVALVAASLASDCAAAHSGTWKQQSCASDAPNCACQQSNVSIKVTASAGARPVAMHVQAVRIFDAAGNQELGVLSAREPSRWNGSAYVSWNEQIAPLDDYTVSYKLSAPDWASIAPSDSARSASYRVIVELEVGGQSRTISLDGISREPIIST